MASGRTRAAVAIAVVFVVCVGWLLRHLGGSPPGDESAKRLTAPAVAAEPDAQPNAGPASRPTLIALRPFADPQPVLVVVSESGGAVPAACVSDAAGLLGRAGPDGLFPLDGGQRTLLVWADDFEPIAVALVADDLLPRARKLCTLVRGATLAGRVVDESGVGIAGMPVVAAFGGSAADAGTNVGGLVAAATSRPEAHVHAVTSDESGAFRFTGLRRGKHAVRVTGIAGFVDGGRGDLVCVVPAAHEVEIRVMRAFVAVLVPRGATAAQGERWKQSASTSLKLPDGLTDTDPMEFPARHRIAEAVQKRFAPQVCLVFVARAARGTPAAAVLTSEARCTWPTVGRATAQLRFVAADFFKPSDVTEISGDFDFPPLAKLTVKSAVKCTLTSGGGGGEVDAVRSAGEPGGETIWRFEAPPGDYVLTTKMFNSLMGEAWCEPVHLTVESETVINWLGKQPPAVLKVQVCDAGGNLTNRFALSVGLEGGADFLTMGERLGGELSFPSRLGNFQLILFDGGMNEVSRTKVALTAADSRPTIRLAVAAAP